MSDAKAELRSALRRARSELAAARIADETAATVSTLRTLLDERGHPPLASYMAVRGELDLHPLHHQEWSSGRPVWLPRVCGKTLTWHPVLSVEHVRPGSFAIAEPDPERVPEATLPRDVVLLVPGIGFAADGFRLGQGAGFYDRALPGFSGLTIGVGFTCQRSDGMPREPHDHPLRAILLGGRWVLPPRPPTSR